MLGVREPATEGSLASRCSRDTPSLITCGTQEGSQTINLLEIRSACLNDGQLMQPRSHRSVIMSIQSCVDDTQAGHQGARSGRLCGKVAQAGEAGPHHGRHLKVRL